MIIDIHTHTFPKAISERVMAKLGRAAGILPHTTGSADALLESTKKAGITWSVNQPVMTSPEQTHQVNQYLFRHMEGRKQKGLLTFGGIHPLNEDYKEVLKELSNRGIRGIKLHPAYQGVDFSDIHYKRIIAEASELDLAVLVHAGIDIGLNDHNYCSVSDILELVKEVQPGKLILAHMGNWDRWDEVESDLAGAPVYMDSAFTVAPLDIYPGYPNTYGYPVLSDEQFLRISRKHGFDRILFGSDCPWEDQSVYVERFRNMGLTEEEQNLFFYENAAKIMF